MKSLVRVKGLCYDLEFGVSLPNFWWSPLDDAKFSRLQAIRPTPGAKVEDISLKMTWLKRREEWILQIPQRFKILTVYFTILWYQTLGFTPVCEVYVIHYNEKLWVQLYWILIKGQASLSILDLTTWRLLMNSLGIFSIEWWLWNKIERGWLVNEKQRNGGCESEQLFQHVYFNRFYLKRNGEIRW